VLDLDGAAYRVDNTGKLDEQPVTGGLDDAAPMFFDLGIRQLGRIALSAASVPSSSAPISRE